MSVADDYNVESATGTTDPLRVDIGWDFGLDISQLNITQQNDTTGEIKQLSLGDFTATVKDDDGVYVNVENFYGAGTSITVSVTRNTPKTQTYTLVESVPLNPEALEDALDKHTKLIQEAIINTNDQVITSVNPFSITDKVTRANKILRFDANGFPVYGTVDAAIDDAIDYAQEWAVKPEDTSVSVEAGGGPSSFSALHYATKTAANAIACASSAAAADASEIAAAASETNAALSAVASNKIFAGIWNYDNTVAAETDPLSTNVRFDSATLANVTEAYISDTDFNSDDKQGLFDLVSTDNTLILQDATTTDNLATFIVNNVVDQTNYTKLELELINSTGALPANGIELYLAFIPLGQGSGFPRKDTTDKTTAYTIVSGDIGFNIPVGSGTTADFDITLDVSLLSAGETLGIINESDYIARIVVSNTGTMTINTNRTDVYLSSGQNIWFTGDTTTNCRITSWV